MVRATHKKYTGALLSFSRAPRGTT